MKKQIWGNAVWFLFHTLAYKLKPEYREEISILYDEIVKICNNLPCPDCQTHAMQFLRKTDKSKVIHSNETLIYFLYDFHNIVNVRVKNPSFSKDKLNETYSKANTQAIIQYFNDVMNESTNNSKMLLYSFHRKNNNSKFKDYIIENNYKYNP
jgi:hypothetical protein